MSWVLVMYIYAGVFAKGDSVTMLSVDGFSSQATCVSAGKQGEPLVADSSKNYRYVCVQKK